MHIGTHPKATAVNKLCLKLPRTQVLALLGVFSQKKHVRAWHPYKCSSSVVHDSPWMRATPEPVGISFSRLGDSALNKYVQALPGRTHHATALPRAFVSLCFVEISRTIQSIAAEYGLVVPGADGEVAKEMEFPHQNMKSVFLT